MRTPSSVFAGRRCAPPLLAAAPSFMLSGQDNASNTDPKFGESCCVRHGAPGSTKIGGIAAYFHNLHLSNSQTIGPAQFDNRRNFSFLKRPRP